MSEAVFASVVAGLLLAIILGLLNVQRHVQEWYVVSERAWKDYWALELRRRIREETGVRSNRSRPC